MENKNNEDILAGLFIENTPSQDINNSVESEQIIEKIESQEEIISEVIQENQTDLQIETTPAEEVNLKEEKKTNKFLDGFVFLIKYMMTSTLIFSILMFGANYNAYINIAKSYLYEEEMQQASKSLINSVEASNIKNKFETEISHTKEETGLTQEDGDQNMSMKKIMASSKQKEVNMDIEITPYTNRIIIPKIGKNIPLVDVKNKEVSGKNELNDIFMKELEKGVVRYPGSAKPGETGNSFIFGHSSNFPWMQGDFNEVFALLDKVGYDDDIIIYYKQKKYVYRIKEKRVITPGDVSILKRDKGKKELSLMTCWPIGTTLNRLIVTGEIVEESDIN